MKIHNKCTATLIDSIGNDLRVANAARVSFDKWKDEFDEKDAKLIRYLANPPDGKIHWAPFGHVMATMRLEMPIFTARQWIKSDKGCIRNDNGVESEVSRRYVDSEPEFYIPDVFHARPEGGLKQGSGDIHKWSDGFRKSMLQNSYDAFYDYNHRISVGLAPEEARILLPQNTMTTIIETGSLAYYARVFGLRTGSGAQDAVGQLAEEVGAIIQNIAPVCWKALTEKTA